jgi:uncharacterized protein
MYTLSRPATASLNPFVEIKINGMPLAQSQSTAIADLLSVTVTEATDALGMFAITLKTQSIRSGNYTWLDHSLFEVGNAVEIRMGNGTQIDTLMVGEITGLEPEFEPDQVPILVVRGHDLRHRLMRGQKTQTFAKMKDSAIASQIAQAVGLGATVEDTQVTLEYVLQHNQTDWEFLQSRAQRIGYEVAIANKTLSFQPPRNTTDKVLTLTYGQALQSFYPRLSSMNQSSTVEVRGWDVKQKQPTEGKANAAEVPLAGVEQTSGLKSTQQAFGQANRAIVTAPISSAAEAKQMAKGQLEAMALTYITGQATCPGNPQVRAGRVVEMAGVGKRFGGLYYVTATTHTYAPGRGYRTEFEVRRNST